MSCVALTQAAAVIVCCLAEPAAEGQRLRQQLDQLQAQLQQAGGHGWGLTMQTQQVWGWDMHRGWCSAWVGGSWHWL